MILDRILTSKRDEVARAKQSVSLEQLMTMVGESDRVGSNERTMPHFRDALRAKPGISLIAEVKKASPSKGVIRPDFDPVQLALEYVENGARAVSILTDQPFFQGDLAHLVSVRQAVSVPLLRKEFIIDPYQIYEAKHAGADAILLIVAALSDSMLKELHELARTLGLDVLVEIHTEDELERALTAGSTIIGINNRDLKTFVTSLDVSHRIVPMIPSGVTIVSESGIQTRDDVLRLEDLGVDAILVGESLAKEQDVAGKVQSLLGLKDHAL